MINAIKFNKGLLITLIIALIFLMGFYGEVLLNANDYIFAPSGDGIKNYFTYMHHIKNDTSINHFGGMAYPYGDLHILTDGHTLLSSFLQLIPGAENWAVGFLNFIILSSFPITACVIFKLLKTYNVKNVIAITFSITIMMLAPQYTRMFGHISMAYSFFLPVTWYWLRQYNLTLRNKFTIYLSLFQVILYFTHPYMGVMSLFFIVLHQSIDALFNKKKRSLKVLIHTFYQALLPVILFQLYVIIVDSAPSRASYKFNFGAFNLDWQAVFFSHSKPFDSAFKDIFDYGQLDWESWSYIGLVNIVFSGLIFYRFIFGKRKWFRFKNSSIIIVGIFGLLHAAGFFFNYGFGFILDLVPQIRQIRVLSRFAWIFYFTVSVFVAVYFNKVFVTYIWKNKRPIAYGLLTLILILNTWESFHYHNKANEKMTKCKNPFILENLSDNLQREIKHLNKKEYQALLALPYFQIGGDRTIHQIKDHKLFFDILAITYHTNIPLINSCLSRSNNNNLSNLSRILTENYIDQPLRESFIKDGKKIALIKGNKPLTQIDKRALSFGSQLSFSERFYDFDYRNAMKNYKDSVLKFYKENHNTFHHQSQLSFKDSNAQVIFENYDFYGNNKELIFRGEAARQSKFNKYTTIIDLKSRLKNIEYDVSFWYYSDMDTTNHIMFFIQEEQEKKPIKWSNVIDTKVNYKHLGKWSFVEFTIKPKYPNGTQKLMLKGSSKYFNPAIFFDQLLIKEKGTDVYADYDGELFKNNYPVGKL